MKRACLIKNTNTDEQCQASSIRPLKNNFVRMKLTKYLSSTLILILINLININAQTTGKTPPSGSLYENIKLTKQGIARLMDIPATPLIPEAKPIKQKVTSKTAATYTYAQLAAMTTSDAVAAILQMTNSRDITDSYQFSQGAIDFYSKTELIDALFARFLTIGTNWQPNDDMATTQLDVIDETLRAGSYLGFYNTPLAFANSMSYKNKFIQPLLALLNNPNVGWGTTHSLSYSDKSNNLKVLYVIGRAISSGVTSLDIMNKLTVLIKEFNDKHYICDPAMADAMYYLGGGADYAIYWLGQVNGSPTNSPLYNQIDNYLNEIARIAETGVVPSPQLYVELNAIYWIGNNSGKATTTNNIQTILQTCLDTYPYGSQPYIETLKWIDYNYKSLFPSIDVPTIKQDLQNQILPHRFSFDNGKRIFITGDKVDTAKVIILYWATKQVQDNFQTLVGYDTPVDAGARADSTLTAYIYNSPADYKAYNGFFYGLSTENGGMYIEGWGKFFTYERTIYESIYTLEDLFRHEFTHYLQGRYLCPGDWNASPLYDNERLTWVEEGNAEYQAGSTRDNGTPNRKSMVGGISSTSSDRYTVAQVTGAKYNSGFTFYTYAYAFMHFLYDKHVDQMFDLLNLVRTKNTTAIDNLYQYFNTNYQAEFSNYMQDLVNNVNNYTDPVTPTNYWKNIAPKDTTELYNEIITLTPLSNASITTQTSDFFKTVSIRGTYNLGATQGAAIDKTNMELKKDEILRNTFTDALWNGYHTFTAHAVNYRVTGGVAQFDLVFKGLKPDNIITGFKETNYNTLLLDIYPNPSKGSSNIRFTTTQKGNVQLAIYNTQGILVKNVCKGFRNAGSFNEKIDLSSLSEGLYFVQLTTDNQQQTKKVVLINKSTE